MTSTDKIMEDKTIRVWDLASGKTVRTIRGESAPGQAGKVHAMVLSLDGKWLAVGGWMDVERPFLLRDIRLYEFASGSHGAVEGHMSGPPLSRGGEADFGSGAETSGTSSGSGAAAAPARRA
jgi:WD40 repeat protein